MKLQDLPESIRTYLIYDYATYMYDRDIYEGTLKIKNKYAFNTRNDFIDYTDGLDNVDDVIEFLNTIKGFMHI